MFRIIISVKGTREMAEKLLATLVELSGYIQQATGLQIVGAVVHEQKPGEEVEDDQD